MLERVEQSQEPLAKGRKLKRVNAIAAALSGLLPPLVLSLKYPLHPGWVVLGFFLGFLWGNFVEYAFHRWVLHVPINYFMRRHVIHHSVFGTSQEAEHVNFGGSPIYVVALFAVNEIPVLLVDRVLNLGFAPGAFIAFSFYFILLEEIHWRIHLGGWLPPLVQKAVPFHFAHHRRPHTRYSVFLPLFDWVLGTAKGKGENLSSMKEVFERAEQKRAA